MKIIKKLYNNLFGFKKIMKKASIIYEEEITLIAKYYHPKSDDYLDYKSRIQIKEKGKMPVVITLKFIGIPPFAAPMPPEPPRE